MADPVMPDLRLRDFHNRLRILKSIDLYELQEAGIEMEDVHGAGWDDFRGDPFCWLIRASDSDAAKVWAIMDDRAAYAAGRAAGGEG